MKILEQKKITVSEYLAYETKSEDKYEYHDGWLVAMAGGSMNHSQIIANTIAELTMALKKEKCRVFDSNLKVWVQTENRFLYPDAMVICDDPILYKDRNDILENPMLIIEVLSPSTEVYDRSEKFIKYRSLSSFKEYVLISSDRIKVETFYKETKGLWRINSVTDINGSIELFSIGKILSLHDIYDKMEDLIPPTI